MKIIFAPDSFKGSLSAIEICDILEKVTLRHFPGAETLAIPVADGGEGTVDALLRATGGKRINTQVRGPVFTPVAAEWGLLENGTAVMEMAAASGLPLVPPEKRDPRHTTSLGTGEMIAHALNQGVRNILIGIGGSATNDGGLGMLTALGASFLDGAGKPVSPTGDGLKDVAQVNLAGLHPALQETKITVICDVTNPLLGETGATFIYGPQKGAIPAIRDELEAGMAHYAQVVGDALGRDIASAPGAGAAGGLGAALGGMLGAQLRSGIDAVLDAVSFEEKLQGASLVITGEGRMDSQSIRFGKVPVGVARRAAAQGIPVLAMVGGIGDGAEGFFDLCEGTIQTIASGPMALEKAMAEAAPLLEAAADRLLRAVKIGIRLKDAV